MKLQTTLRRLPVVGGKENSEALRLLFTPAFTLIFYYTTTRRIVTLVPKSVISVIGFSRSVPPRLGLKAAALARLEVALAFSTAKAVNHGASLTVNL
jgi:hypothetical protein